MLQAGLLNLSSVMNMAPYFFIAPSYDYRYIYWTVFATVVAVVMSAHALYLYVCERLYSGQIVANE
jgi:hypothetical protein